MILGCIADDLTGASDLGNTLARQGLRVTQFNGIPKNHASANVEAGIVALKTRSIDPELAVKYSLEALAWLQSQGCQQFFFKICSTFDSTKNGNIGPVAMALAEALNEPTVLICPAFPGTGRSVYQGHLFVNDVLLSASPMSEHPLNPMTESDIRIWLQHQVLGRVGHVPYSCVSQGHQEIASALDEAAAEGTDFVIVDAIRDQDLMEIGKAATTRRLLVGGSGLALGLPANYRVAGLASNDQNTWSGVSGDCVALCGSCSPTSLEQIRHHAQNFPALALDVIAVLNNDYTPQQACDWVASHREQVPLVYSSADAAELRDIHASFGVQHSSNTLEHFFASLAELLVDIGITKLVVGGGETSGAVIEKLAISQLELGPEIDPGVPALITQNGIGLVLKSGNFGGQDLFARAARALGEAVGQESN